MARITLDPALIAGLCVRYNIREVALFGSVTRDDFRPDSDVDVLVDFAPDAQIGLFDLIGLKEELSTYLGREVDLVTKGMLSPFFRDEVLAQREVIYVTPQ
ncbi:MAG TPA: nucleotidyltransferase family protein [Symbiobacteriaceae bacterium]|nr:nucleotidyltransferase family protein [Symbiobacteriaceae bacterium]